ncbi:glycosyltransferase [Clostridium saccharobutylicum]|uniref:Glycosyltransferase n=1 Tax=Clostridium saccharobutylicum DSM 13864 TaxID=1345695 RepID=U5MWL2_CLOSA|nr:glycosyltransferase [Clostridium saccharobutylicum]AGX45194.1 glycosyltransferase [Clostridium saccharobutylicum DSM 13864]AQR92472.1 processive diacylglycerol beta-glucosyltransferase [Clostridium saccharobutylicum]AQS02375.1 processive diacylglycerol beta-glucosyltransferase [Clostridium saccharobutylicum]AQS16358.1 processive diacylglycerol beta-glucosyltransferase [Clostridium saccharobutylicum]MBA2905037.1 glycosyltransferase involved in cell wall biosynthesis [Clostridium saccharobuty
MKILFITNLLPYPLDNGGKIKSYNTLEMLSEENDVDIFSFYESRKELDSLKYMKSKFNNVHIIEKPLTTSKNIKKMIFIAFRSLFNKLPFVLLKFKDNNMSQLLKKEISKNKYDLVYIDHLQLGVYWDILKMCNCPIYLDEHNCESQILKRKIKSGENILKNCFIRLEYKKLKNFEDKIVKKCDKVIVLSEEDKKCLMNGVDVNKNKFTVIPIPIQADFMKTIGSRINNKKTLNIMFLGTLTWFPNSQGIEWFVDKVIPKLEQTNSNYKLFIVGKDPSESLMNKCKQNNKIIVTGYVDDVNEYIEKCDIMIVPIFVGSGMRVKILEGLGKRIPIISTQIGAEGIDVENEKDILLAENEQEFINSIVKLTDNELYSSIQKSGRKLFDSKYSIEAVITNYKRLVLNDKELKKNE